MDAKKKEIFLSGGPAKHARQSLSVPWGFLNLRSQKIGWFDVTYLDLVLPGLEAPFNGYRLAHLSDIHLDGNMSPHKLDQVIATVNELKPDLVAITGDFVTHRPHHHAPALQASLSRLSAPDGVLAVLGNHDHWSDSGVVRAALAGANIHELRNSAVQVCRGGAALNIAGIDDHLEQCSNLDHAVEALADRSTAILLAHEPDIADISAATGRFALQLSGHSHGGQINLPGLGAPYLPGQGRKYHTGLYQVDDMLVYTSRGLGTMYLPIRINSRPEIGLITLRSVRSKRSGD